MKKLLAVLFTVLASLVFSFTFVGADPVEVSLSGFLVEQTDNGEVLLPLETKDEPPKAAPGDTLEYFLVARNNTDQSIEGLSLKGPVPESTELNEKWYQGIVKFVKGEEEEPPIFMVLREDKTSENSREVSMGLPERLPKFSIDGGKSYSFPPVKYEEDGETKEAEASQITNVLWEVPELPANGAVQVRYRVSVQ